MTDPLRIGILSTHNSYDRNSFSGTPYYMRRALEAVDGVEVTVMGGHGPVRKDFVSRVMRRLRGPVPFDISGDDQDALDAILAPSAVAILAELGDKVTAPLMPITDATPAFLEEFYGDNITARDYEIEGQMLARATAMIYSSHFMAERALVEFDTLDADRAHVIPFGINLDTLPAAIPQKPPLTELRLLFIGQDWERKGGAIALETLDALLAEGVPARLSIIGSSSPEADAHPSVDVLGYLDKNKPQDMTRFNAALSDSHLLLFPTRADCTPMVIAEANAYGCPVVVTETGGIGTLLKSGVNGRLMPMEARGAEYAKAVQDLTATPEAYDALCRSAFEFCHETLTWQAWARDILKLVRQVKDGQAPQLQTKEGGA